MWGKILNLPVLGTIMKATPTENKLTMQTGGFATLVEALEYAAQGDTGFNFYDGKGQLHDVLTYTRLKKKAQAIAAVCVLWVWSVGRGWP